jgi:hypothetical protein
LFSHKTHCIKRLFFIFFLSPHMLIVLLVTGCQFVYSL